MKRLLLATAAMLAALIAPAAAVELTFQTLKFERDGYAGGSIHALLAIDSAVAYRFVRISCVATLKDEPVFEGPTAADQVISGRTIKRVTFVFNGLADKMDCRAVQAFK
jgi:hypothetical protein